jgi:hypothetical protein
MNVYDVLKEEDARLLKLLRKLEDTTSGQTQDRELLLNQVRIHTKAQIQVEEGHLYPALRLQPELVTLFEHLEREHREIKNLLDQLNETPSQDERFELIIERLSGQADKLINWRKQELFPKAERVLPADQAEMLGEVVEEEIRTFRREIAHA